MGKLSAISISPVSEKDNNNENNNHTNSQGNATNPDKLANYHPRITETKVSKKKLGEGGFSVVYLGKLDDQKCAVKTMHYVTEEAVNFVQSELDILRYFSKTPSAYIVKFYGAFTKDIYCHIVTEYMNHGSLKHFINEWGYSRVNTEKRIDMAKQIAMGLSFIHSVDMIHCDIKPHNLLVSVDADGNISIKFTDFGLSQKASPNQRFTGGTTNWQAPEVLIDGKISFASDVYSTSLVFWQLIAAKKKVNTGFTKTKNGAFTDSGANDLKITRLKNYLEAGNRPKIPSKCPTEFKALITDMWKTKPEDRPTAEHVTDRLNALKYK